MTTLHERALVLARYNYWQYMEQTAAERGDTVALGQKEKCLRGDFDEQHGVKIALAAILRTTELAAEWVAEHGPSDDIGNHETAEAISTGRHLKKAPIP